MEEPLSFSGISKFIYRKTVKKEQQKKYKVLRFVSKRIEQMTNFSVVTFRDDQ